MFKSLPGPRQAALLRRRKEYGRGYQNNTPTILSAAPAQSLRCAWLLLLLLLLCTGRSYCSMLTPFHWSWPKRASNRCAWLPVASQEAPLRSWLSIIQPSRAVTQLADWHTRPTTRCTAPCPSQVKQWCPAATSVAAARVGSGALALTLAESFDIVHAFEADETRCRYLQANVELTGRDWIVVHGVPTEEEGDYLFAADEMECDVVFLSLLCPDHDLDRVNADPEASSPAGAPRLPSPTAPTAAVRGAARPLCVQPRTYTASHLV
eukprot:COSAG01_NODE_1805_length_9192_cov_13.807324_6_plen_265_part_00